MKDINWLYQKPIAHRGLHDATLGIIENSASSVTAAIEKGYAIEIDVQPDMNTVPIVFHDARLERLTETFGAINQFTRKQLAQIRLSGSSDTIISLRDLLDLVDGQAALLVEIKSDFSNAEDFALNVAKCLAEYKGVAAFMSFNPRQVRAGAEQAPHLPKGLTAGGFNDTISKERLFFGERFVLRHLLTGFFIKPDFIAYDIRALPAFAPYTAKKLFGRKLLAWTVRTKAQQIIAERWADTIIFEAYKPSL